VKDESRDVRGTRWLDDLRQDLRYALRALGRSPAFTAVAVTSLALGIGINSTIFSLTMEAMFARPSIRDPQSVVYVRMGGSDTASVALWRFLHDQGGIQDITGADETGEANWRLGDETHHLYTAHVTGNFFDTAGVPLLFGRPIQTGDRDNAVISYGFWQQWFSGDREIVGKALVLDGHMYTITGVLPRNHRSIMGLGMSPDVYLPATRDTDQVSLYVRIPKGLNRAAIRSQLNPLCQELDKIKPRPEGASKWEKTLTISSVAGIEHMEAWGLLPVAGFFAVLLVVVGLVLLMACANVASLLLARASSRRQELAIRTALGASRGRIVRQLIAESSLLAMLGAAGGLMMNLLLTQAMNTISLPVSFPIRLSMRPDWRLLEYLAVVAFLTTIATGLLPALRAARIAIQSRLKENAGNVGKARWNLRSALVVGQLAISALLLLTTSLFARNLIKAGNTDLGFNVNDTLCAHMRLVPGKYTTVEQIEHLTDSALDQIRSLPGVEAASAVRIVPMNDVVNIDGDLDFQTDLGSKSASSIETYDLNWVGTDYFRTMDISIVEGRPFLPSDRLGTPEVAIINQEMARRIFGNMSPIGRTLTIAPVEKHPITIVGVARNSKYWKLGEDKMPAFYKAYAQGNFRELPADIQFLVRASNRDIALVKLLNHTLGALDPTAFIETKTMRSSLEFALLPSRAGAIITGSVGVLGVTLAAIGLYGLLLYAVSQRTKEIGLRMALGATMSDIIRTVLGESLVLCALGLALGLGIAVFAARPLSMFFVPGLTPGDPPSFILVGGILLAICLAATLPPVLNALRVDPMIALRHEAS
jgi:predicted permease